MVWIDRNGVNVPHASVAGTRYKKISDDDDAQHDHYPLLLLL